MSHSTPPLKLSRFNIVARVDADRIVLNNTLTGAVAVLPDKDYRTFCADLRRGNGDLPVTTLQDQLRSGGFLVPADMHEEERVSYLAHSALYRTDYLDLRILPTEECNLRCVYCYETFSRGEMTPEIRRRVALLLNTRGPRLNRLSVGWFGGEPLLAMDTIREISNVALSLRDKYGFAYDSNVTTNGVLLNADTLSDLIALGVTFFQVTIDGVSREHDLRRHFQNGGGTYDILMDNLRESRHVDGPFRLVIRMNFDEESLASCRELIHVLKPIIGDDPRYGVFFRPIADYGNPDVALAGLRLATGKARFASQFLLEREAHANAIGVSGGFEPPMLNRGMCYAAFPHCFVIGSDASVYKCTVHFKSEMNRVGLLGHDGALMLDPYKMSLWVGAKADDDPVCRSCVMRPSCHKAACPASHVGGGGRRCPMPLGCVKRGLGEFVRHTDTVVAATFKKEDPK